MELVATALPALNEAFALILQPQQIMFLVLGVLLGLSVGVFPGLGGIAGLSLVLPFMFGMDPVSARWRSLSGALLCWGIRPVRR